MQEGEEKTLRQEETQSVLLELLLLNDSERVNTYYYIGEGGEGRTGKKESKGDTSSTPTEPARKLLPDKKSPFTFLLLHHGRTVDVGRKEGRFSCTRSKSSNFVGDTHEEELKEAKRDLPIFHQFIWRPRTPDQRI